MRGRRLNTYTGYSISCAAVWAAMLAVGERRLDRRARDTLRLSCLGWWSGWTSATIARVMYPPPTKLEPATQKRLGSISRALIAAGLINVVRLLAGGKRPVGSE